MKRWIVWGLLPVLLTGCASAETLETVADEPVQVVMASPGSVTLQLPQEVAAPVMQDDTSQLYLGDGYEILLENRPAGDIDATVRALSGFQRESLTVIKTSQGSADRYEFVWVAAGEQGDRLGRAVILDDGNYHYCLSVLHDAAMTAGDRDLWQPVFASFRLSDSFIRTG